MSAPWRTLAAAAALALALALAPHLAAAKQKVPVPATAKAGRPLPPKPFGPVAPSAPLALRPVKVRNRTASRGVVVSVVAPRAYLSAGARDGLKVGQRIAVSRRGRAAGTCTVTEVSAWSATCAGERIQAGDRFALEPPRPSLRVKTLAPVLSAAETSRRRAAVEAAAVPLVEFKAKPSALGFDERAEARLSHATYVSGPETSPVALNQEQLDLRVYGASVAPGWRLYVDASGIYRGDRLTRVRRGESAILELHELSLASREPNQALAVSVGRVLPWSAPGSTIFDGAQIGWRGADAEVGVFGGFVPDVATTAPTTDRSTGGLYGSIEHATQDVLLRGEGRLAMVRSPELGTRFEAEGRGHAWIARRIDLAAEVRFAAGDRTAEAGVDSLQLELSGRLAQPLWFSASFRYVGLTIPDTGLVALFPNVSRHGEASVAWDVSRLLTLRGTAGFAKDLTTGLDREWIGPEVVLPRAFGRFGSLTAGWAEESGWVGGRYLWLQAQAQPWRPVHLLARGSYQLDAPTALVQQEVIGLVLTSSFELTQWLALNLSTLDRVHITANAPDTTLGGVSGFASLVATY